MYESTGETDVHSHQESTITTTPPQSTLDPTTDGMTATDTLPYLHVDRRQEVFRMAGTLYRQSPDWVMFFRETLGVDGIVRKMFRTPEELAAFERTAEYEDIQHMIAKLREKTAVQTDDKEPTRVITVRLPKSLHETLRTEAHERRTSMNKLCISKLLQVVDNEMVPQE